MVQALVGKKIEQTQKFLSDGRRVPTTLISVSGNVVTKILTQEKNGYFAAQLGFGTRKKPSKSLLGQIKGTNVKNAPFLLREVPLSDSNLLPSVGDTIDPQEVLKPGDIVAVTGVSKGKGFAGGVKRHHFKGGPRTHGQSDRERAPGSIGQTTTPGRVYKGKRMAGRMGNETTTVKNLKVIDVTDTRLLVAGLVPGNRNSYVVVKKIGEMKEFSPLFKEVQQTENKPEENIKEEKE